MPVEELPAFQQQVRSFESTIRRRGTEWKYFQMELKGIIHSQLHIIAEKDKQRRTSVLLRVFHIFILNIPSNLSISYLQKYTGPCSRVGQYSTEL